MKKENVNTLRQEIKSNIISKIDDIAIGDNKSSNRFTI